MFTAKINYVDYDGIKQEEEVRLNLTKPECKELDLKYESEGGIFQHLKSLIGNKKGSDIPQKPLYEFLIEIIELAYGKKSDDGRRFIKRNPDGSRLAYEFMDSACCAKFIEMILSEEIDLDKFINSVFPEINDEDRKKAEEKAKEEFGI